MAVRMTERAAEEFKSVCNSKSLPIESTMLRIDGEQTEEEGKLTLSLSFENQQPREEDIVEITEGAQLVIDKGLDEFLGEIRLDYREDKGGFVLQRLQ
jgi:Fe-S cluster assembly iron-binding protein IscA